MSRFSNGQIVTMVVAACAAVVLAPAGVIAATSYVTITDATTGSKAKVDVGKVRVGDGSGGLTVDGTVRSANASALIYKSPAGGLNCGTSGTGYSLGAFDLSKYSRIRIAIQNSPNYQSIVHMRARAGTETIPVPFVEWTVPAGQAGHNVFYEPPTSAEIVVFFCSAAKVFIYGLV